VSPPPLGAAAATTRSSTSEFQAPHSGQRPSQRGIWAEQEVQVKTVAGFFATT
jgi:hypothetical protein